EFEEDLIIEEPEAEGELSELIENTDDDINEFSSEEELPEVLDEDKSFSTEPDEKLNEDSAIRDAFNYAEERRARLNNYNKRSKSGFVFAGIFVIVIAAVIYLFYFFSDNNQQVLQTT